MKRLAVGDGGGPHLLVCTRALKEAGMQFYRVVIEGEGLGDG